MQLQLQIQLQLQLQLQFLNPTWDSGPEEKLRAMPQAESRVPHPDVPGFKAVFPSGKSRIRTNTENWIRSMYQPRPKYPVDYTPPTQVKPLETPAPPRVPR